MDQTLNAKTMDENNETFKHDTEFHEFRTAWHVQSRSRSATCEDDQGGDAELSMTIRKNVIIKEYESDTINPNDTILTMNLLESSRKEMWRIRNSRRVPAA